MQTLGWLSAALLLALLSFGLAVFVGQRRLAYPGTSRVTARASTVVPEDVTQAWLTSPSGSVEAWYLPAHASPPTPAIVFAHGNYELIDDWLGPMRAVQAMGIAVMLVEYPGYGHSQGSPSRASMRAAFSAAYDWLARRPDVGRGRIVGMGRSLGGAVVADLDSDRELAGLVLLSTFSSAARLAWEALRVPGFLVRDRFDVESVVRLSDTPVLIVHGEHDDVVPFSHAHALASQREGLVPVRLPCAHNDCMEFWPAILEALEAFLRERGILTP